MTYELPKNGMQNSYHSLFGQRKIFVRSWKTSFFGGLKLC